MSVAPNSLANSSFSSDRSTAKMREASAILAPAIAFIPTPPTP